VPQAQSSVTGECRLCGAPDVVLKDSHIIPKWAFKRAAGGGNAPVRISDGLALQTSRQVKEYLLCDACEALLCKDEDVVARLAYQVDGSIGLLRDAQIERWNESGPYVGRAEIPNLDTVAIARFGASVFWRAHVSTRPECRQMVLWEQYSEVLRGFIRGQSAMRWDMCITLHALFENRGATSAHCSTIIFPVTQKRGDDGFHQFFVAGLVFNLWMGSFATDQRGLCLARGASTIGLVSWRHVGTLQEAASKVHAAKPTGRFAEHHAELIRLRRL
jgi:hypothetical protein